MTAALVFPGQGSQALGMGRALADSFPVARQTFQEVDDALGRHLSRIMWGDSDAELTLTSNAQPALMAASLATLRVVITESGRSFAELCSVSAGHSLGEYTALAASGALELGAIARLLQLRATAMQDAVPVGFGTMAALLPVDPATAEAIAEEASAVGVCAVANDNGAGQIVLSGERLAIDRAIDIAKARGVKRAIVLPVSAPFHCALMQPAATRLAEALEEVNFAAPARPVIANFTAASVTDPAAIAPLLVAQITGRVRWRETMAMLAAGGVDLVVELGPGQVLGGLAKRSMPDVRVLSAGAPGDLDAVLAVL